MHEVVADEEERFIAIAGKGVSEAVTKVEPGGMAPALAIPLVGETSDPHMVLCNWFY